MAQKSTPPPSRAQTVAITNTEFLTDSVRVYYYCRRPWGADDERTMVELPYAAISALPGLTLDHAHGEFREAWVESVYIPACNSTICFRFAKWQETDDCRMEGLVGGPYLATPGDRAAVTAT